MVETITTLRMFLWRIFPQFGVSALSDIFFIACVLAIASCVNVYKIKTDISFSIIAWLALSFLSIFYSKNHGQSMIFVIGQSINVLLFSLITNHKRTMSFIFFILTILAVEAVRESFYIQRAYSFLGWPTATSGVLILAIPFLIIKRRIIPAIILIAGLLATKSISSVLSLCIVLAFMFKWRSVPYIILSAIALLLLRQDIYGSLLVRYEYLMAGIDAVSIHFLKGSGAGTFFIDGFSKTAYAHNSYLQVWAECGILAFISMCCFVYKIAMMKPCNKTQVGIYFGLMAFLIDNVMNFTLLRNTTSIYFWLLLACYIATRSPLPSRRS